MRVRRVRALLMGGQACVLYGAAEFSRDTDFATANLARLRLALADLRATLTSPSARGGFSRCPIRRSRRDCSPGNRAYDDFFTTESQRH